MAKSRILRRFHDEFDGKGEGLWPCRRPARQFILRRT
jgi:hypothetical protein